MITDSVSLEELRVMSEKMHGGLVKAVVDLDTGSMVIDAELHADEEAMLLEQGSVQASLWGINLYPDAFRTDDFIEFDSMINLRPSHGNRSRGVDDENIQKKIRDIISQRVHI